MIRYHSEIEIIFRVIKCLKENILIKDFYKEVIYNMKL